MLMSSIWSKGIGLQGLSGLPVFGEVSIAGPQASTGSPVFQHGDCTKQFISRWANAVPH